MKTGFLGVIALCGVLGGALAFSTGCVVAATGTNADADEKSQTEQLDTTDNTASNTGVKLPDYNDTKASGGQGGGPDPSPWRETIAAENGGPNGPDPSPWDSNPNATNANTRK